MYISNYIAYFSFDVNKLRDLLSSAQQVGFTVTESIGEGSSRLETEPRIDKKLLILMESG